MMGIISCSNCEQTIGNIEPRYNFKGSIVCVTCFNRLSSLPEVVPVAGGEAETEIGFDDSPVPTKHACARCGGVFEDDQLDETLEGLLCESCRAPEPSTTATSPAHSTPTAVRARKKPRNWTPLIACNIVLTLTTLWLIQNGTFSEWFGSGPNEVIVTNGLSLDVSRDIDEINRLIRDSNRLGALRDFDHATAQLKKAKALILSRSAKEVRARLPEVEKAIADYGRLASRAKSGETLRSDDVPFINLPTAPNTDNTFGPKKLPNIQPETSPPVPIESLPHSPITDVPQEPTKPQTPINPNDPETLCAAGWALVPGNMEAAKEKFAAALVLKPSHPHASIGRAVCDLDDSDPAVRKAALDTLERIHVLTPDRVSAINLASALFNSSPARSARILAEFLGRQPQVDEEALNYLGAALKKCSEREDLRAAVVEFGKAYDVDEKKLERGRGDGQKRWGTTWRDAADADRLRATYIGPRNRLQDATRAKNIADANLRNAISDRDENKGHGFRRTNIAAFDANVGNAQTAKADADKNLSAAQKAFQRVESPPWPENIPFTPPTTP